MFVMLLDQMENVTLTNKPFSHPSVSPNFGLQKKPEGKIDFNLPLTLHPQLTALTTRLILLFSNS